MTSAGCAAHWLAEPRLYDGLAMQSLWSYRTCGIAGDSIVAFRGGCDIPAAHILDLEDLLAGSKIYSPDMLHFIIEHFEGDLLLAAHRQRLLAAIVKEWLEQQGVGGLRRDGDDIYRDHNKLSISIAAATPVSCKIHFGVNIETQGVPVPALGLAELDLAPETCARGILAAYTHELAGIAAARCKVRGVE